MRRIIMLFALLVSLVAGTAAAQDQGFGLGIILGEPTGVSIKNWMTQRTAFDLGIAWSFGGREDALHVHGDYLVHNFSLIPVEKGKLPVYFGIGGRIKFADDPNVAVRIAVGLDYLFADAPVDIFLEIVPMLELTPDTDFELNGGIGVRYFF
ncbi:MAG: hypothetical protein HY770_07130 [Chitinivibrionia bacterium]|nr:hypothetical protein [Chitinivibrionia bacterium]